MGFYINIKNKDEILLDTESAFPKMTEEQLEILLVETRLELDKRQGTSTTFKFKGVMI